MSSENKKVLFIDFGPGFGGSVINLAKILASADAMGIEPYVITDHNDQESLDIFKTCTANVVYMNRVKLGISEDGFIARCRIRILKKMLVLFNMIGKVIWNIPFYVRVNMYACKASVEVVQFNNIVGLDEVILARMIGKKTICHAQRIFEISTMTKFFFRFIDRFVAISSYVKNNLIEAGVGEEKISLIYNAVDVDLIDQKAIESSDVCERISNVKGYKVGLFGCLLPWKGQDVLIDAAKILVHEKGRRNIQFYFVGASVDSADDYEASLRRKVSDLELDEYIAFMGYVENVYPVMKRMDIVLNPSDQPEAFGLVVIEAMALGRPVVATDHGGPKEIIQNGENGFLIEPGNAKELADVICDLLVDQDKRLRIGQMGKREVEQRFNIDLFIESFRKIYV